MELSKEYFGPLWKYICNDSITDIDYNGKELWITNNLNERYAVNPAFTREYLTAGFLEQFSQKTANLVSLPFNKRNPCLEAETSDLRVTIVHEAVAKNGRSFSIRKTPPIVRLSVQRALEEEYCTKEILSLLVNAVLAKMNIVVCGSPGNGKTELIKFLSSYIPGNERVITIEDTLEMRYGVSNPGKDCIEMKVLDSLFSYSDAIKTSLRLNPKWIILSEARSKEVKYLLESWSTGIKGLTTLHTDDVFNIPDRILNMLESRVDADRLENDIYQALDVGILVNRKKRENGLVRRFVEQVCFFERLDGQNRISLVVSDGKIIKEGFRKEIINRFNKYGICDPLVCSCVEEEL